MKQLQDFDYSLTALTFKHFTTPSNQRRFFNSEGNRHCSMVAPGFGSSFGDFVSAINILNSVRKALRETNGAKDDFRTLCTELEHLAVLLEQLHKGTWDRGGDAGHYNAVRGMALTVKVPLQEFLQKIEKFKTMTHSTAGAVGLRSVRGLGHSIEKKARQAQWAVQMNEEVENFRAVIVAKILAISLLIQINLVFVVPLEIINLC
jgi:hypothetical protein